MKRAGVNSFKKFIISCVMATVLIAALLLPAAAFEGRYEEQEEAYASGFDVSLLPEISYAEDELIITYSSTCADATLEAAGVSGVDEIFTSDEDAVTVLATLDESVSVAEAIEALMQDPDISWVQPNFTYELLDTGETYTTVDSDAAQEQYYLWSSSFTEAWEYVRVEGSVTVAVLDTGCNLRHEDLADNVNTELAYDATTGRLLARSNVANNGDALGHGTNICGIISASAANGTGIAGASYDAEILPVKVFDSTGECTTADIIAAYSYLSRIISSGEIDNLKVINMSMGYYSDDSDAADTALEQVISDMLEEYGVLTVCAGGNSSDGTTASDYCYPADFDVCVSVTAVDEDGANASFSDFNDAKDISAYGVSIYTTYYKGGYCYTSGTSVAAPQVSAAAALLWAADESLTAAEVVAILKATASEITGNVHEESGSAGILNMLAAVEYLLEEMPEIIELYGSNRYETMEAVVQEAFADSGSTCAVIADGSNFPDALAAASLAGVLDAPIILVSDSTAQSALVTLEELGVTEVYIAGGTSSVSTDIEEMLEDAGISAERLCGETRQETALAIASEVLELSGSEASDTCLVASGASFADALCGSAYSYWSASPIYLADNDGSISEEVLKAIEESGCSNIVVLGGTSSVSASAYSTLEELEGVSVTRLGGSTRYETSALIATWAVSRGMTYNGMAVASGSSFPDALSGSALCGQLGSVLLLANTTQDSTSVLLSVLGQNSEDISLLYILGGTSSVSSEIRDAISSALIEGA